MHADNQAVDLKKGGLEVDNFGADFSSTRSLELAYRRAPDDDGNTNTRVQEIQQRLDIALSELAASRELENLHAAAFVYQSNPDLVRTRLFGYGFRSQACLIPSFQSCSEIQGT